MISTIVAIYNSEKYLTNCVNSILDQTFSGLQIHLVDDGSIDQSAQISDGYAISDDRIIIIHQRNQGVSSARNKGMSLAIGEWISFIDSDDALEPEMYQVLLEMACQYQCEISHCGYKRLNENGELEKEVTGTHKILLQSGMEAIPCLLEGDFFVGGLWNKIIHRNLVNTIYFDETLKCNEDVLFAFLVFQKAKQTVFIDETKYLFYDHPTSATSTIKISSKLNDVICACDIMIGETSDCNTEILSVLKKRRFIHKMALFRTYLLDEGRNDEELRMWLKMEYRKIKGLKISTKVQLYLIVYAKRLYQMVYLLYSKLHKPNWDVRKKV